MLDRPLIGLVMWQELTSHNHKHVAGARSYFKAVESAGGAPYGIAPLSLDALRAVYEPIQGLLLMGGGDVEPSRFGEEPHPATGGVDPERDEIELTLVEWAVEDNKPILGICRGCQLLNVAYGGTLYQDIPSQFETEIDHNASTKMPTPEFLAHGLQILPGTRLATAIGEGSHPTNSRHHQAVKALGQGLVVSGTSEDGIVEAIEAESPSWVVGLQCHPENLLAEQAWAAALFRAFVGEARFRAERRVPMPIGPLVEPAR